jgi:hypothetical protein
MTKSQVITVVLDQMYELFQIDTSEVWPDDSLLEFGLDEKSIYQVYATSLMKLGFEPESTGGRVPAPKTAREIVDQVFARSSTIPSSGASDQAA